MWQHIRGVSQSPVNGERRDATFLERGSDRHKFEVFCDVYQNPWHARYAVSALLNIENGARPLPGESVVSDPSWVVPCLSEELVASFSTSSSQVEAPSTAASLRRVALAWVPSLAASPTWQLFSLLSKTASFLIGFYDRNSLIVILFLKSISDSMLYRGTGSVCC